MLRSASRILGYRLKARDGEVGRCVDFLLEQPTWIIRQVVVDAGPRPEAALERAHVLISPLRLSKLAWASRCWSLEGTRLEIGAGQLENGPQSQANLQSLKQLLGFGLDDAEGNVGHIEDLIVDDDCWHCRYLVVNGEIRLAGRKALVPTEWLGRVVADEHRVQALVARAQIETAPEYRPEAPVYHLHAEPASARAPLAAGITCSPAVSEQAAAPSSSRFSPPVAWSQALHWGTRAIEAALARTTQAGAEAVGGRSGRTRRI